MRLFMSQSPTISDEPGTPEWWDEVQQDREELSADVLDSWLNEEIDFVPRRRFVREQPAATAALTEREIDIDRRPARRAPRTDAENRVLDALDDLGDDVVELVSRPPRRGRTDSFDVVLGDDGALVATETLTPIDDDAVLEVPAVLDRPTVRITGHPELNPKGRVARQRERSLMEIIGPHPDRIAFWVVMLGLALIVLSRLSA